MAPYRRMLHHQALSLEYLPIKRLGPITQAAGALRVHRRDFTPPPEAEQFEVTQGSYPPPTLLPEVSPW